MCPKKRIALYGGTFDPVHLGHLEIARRVCELFEIEKVVFIPAQVAPHKLGRPVTPPVHRYAMLALATQHDAQLIISTFEIDAPDRRYTVDTLSHFVSELGDTSELFFIMGGDSWSEITTWRDWQQLLDMVNHIVVTRPGHGLTGPETVRDKVTDLRSRQVTPNLINESSGTRIYLTDVVFKDVSSTMIRSCVREDRLNELTQFVSEPVAQYIVKYGIYRESNEV
jgi:nicotinate-nucleotide adenylyltransferase